MANEGRIVSVLDELESEVEGRDEIAFGTFLEKLAERGFGPILLVLSAFLLLPVGMIPGMPAIIGAALILVGWQLFKGHNGVRVPEMLKKWQIDADRITESLHRARPWARKIGSLLGKPLNWMTRSRTMLVCVAIAVAASGAVMIGMGFVPGLPAILAVPILMFGTGLTSGNGALVAAGLALVLPAAAGILWLTL